MANATVAPPGAGFRKQFKRNWPLLVMILLPVAYVILFSYMPMAGVVVAFKNFNYQNGIFGSDWIGLKNFKGFFINGTIWPILRNTMLYNIAFIITGMFLEVTFAILLSEMWGKAYKRAAQSVMLLPFFISWVIVAAVLYAVFQDHGVLNHIRQSIGLKKYSVYTKPDFWPPFLVFLKLWKSTGYGSVIYLANITGIDSQIYEAADIDGCNIWQRILFITIPHLRPTMIIMLLLAMGGMFRGDFGLFYQTVGANPMRSVKGVTEIMDTYVYRLLRSTNSDIGMSTAAGLMQSVMCFFTVLIANGVVKWIDKDYALF